MKKVFALTALLLTGVLLFSGCAAGAGKADVIYRGEITSVSEDGSILVTQLPGHNYGQESILFHVSDKLAKELGDTLTVGAFVEVHYNGALTRSLPAQGTAERITVIASYSEGIIQNGTILSVTPGKDGYSISLLPLGQTSNPNDLSNTITLTVHMFALEGLTSADLVEGAKVCAVTSGIAAMSSPPIMQAVALLPYTE